MSNLSNYSDIFANLAQSAYTKRPQSFPEKYEKSKNVEEIDFSKEDWQYDINGNIDKNRTYTPEMAETGKNIGDNGKIYLQSDKTGALTNAKAGYNAYFVTDQPSVSDSQETYFVIDKVKIIQAISFFIYRKFSKEGTQYILCNRFLFLVLLT